MAKKKERTDKQRLAFLAKMEKIDRSGNDNAWAYEAWLYNPNSRNLSTIDVRLSPRGFATRLVDDFAKSIDAAMDLLEGGTAL